MTSQWGAVVRPSFIEGLVSTMDQEMDRVEAIGEVGLSYPGFMAPAHRENQVLFLESSSQLSIPMRICSTYHWCCMSFEKQDASARCLSILEDVGYPRSHKIYRHSFLGTSQEADAWIKAFPSTVSGVSPKALSAWKEVWEIFHGQGRS